MFVLGSVTRIKLAVYIAFLMTLAVWVGAGVHDSISSHPGWYARPVSYVRDGRTVTIPEGGVNPWPFTTAAVAFCTLTALAAFVRHRGPGRREVLRVLTGTMTVLVATGVYFVPTLVKLGQPAALTDEQITAMSHTWMRLNVCRIVLVLALLAYGHVALVRLASTPPHDSRHR
jgi:hypothetical protein